MFELKIPHTYALAHSLTHALAHSLTHALTLLRTHSLTHSLTSGERAELQAQIDGISAQQEALMAE